MAWRSGMRRGFAGRRRAWGRRRPSARCGKARPRTSPSRAATPSNATDDSWRHPRVVSCDFGGYHATHFLYLLLDDGGVIGALLRGFVRARFVARWLRLVDGTARSADMLSHGTCSHCEAGVTTHTGAQGCGLWAVGWSFKHSCKFIALVSAQNTSPRPKSDGLLVSY